MGSLRRLKIQSISPGNWCYWYDLDAGNGIRKRPIGVFGLRALKKNCSVGEPAEGSLSPIYLPGAVSAALA